MITVNQPQYQQSIDDDQSSDLVCVLVLIEVSNDEDLQQLAETAEAKQSEENLQPHEHRDAARCLALMMASNDHR